MPEVDIIIFLFYDCIAGKKAMGDSFLLKDN